MSSTHSILGSGFGVTKQYVDFQIQNHGHISSDINDFRLAVNQSSVSDLAPPTTTLDMAGNEVCGLPGVPSALDCATSKSYVDAQIGGVQPDSIRTVSNLTSVDVADHITTFRNNAQTVLTTEQLEINANVPISMNTNKITDLQDGVLAQDAVSVSQMNSSILGQKLNDHAAANGDIDCGNQNLVNVQFPTLDHHATSKEYVDQVAAGQNELQEVYDLSTAPQIVLDVVKGMEFQESTGTTSVLQISDTAIDIRLPMSVNSQRISDVTDPISAQQASTKNYCDTTKSALGHSHLHTSITDFDTGVRTNKTHELALATASLDMNQQRVIGVLDGVAANDAVNVQQLNSAAVAIDLQTAYTQSATPARMNMTVGKPIEIYASDGVTPVMTWGDNAIQYGVDINNNGNVGMTTGDIGVDGNKLYIDGNVAGKSRITAENTLCLNTSGAASKFIEVQHNTNTLAEFKSTETVQHTPLNMNTVNKIINLQPGTTNLEAVNFQQLQTKAETVHALDSHSVPVGSLNLNGQKIVTLQNGTLAGDAANLGQLTTGLASKANVAHTHVIGDVTNLSTELSGKYLNTTTLDSITQATATVDLGAQKIQSTAVPTLDQDLTNKLYVDNALTGISADQITTGTGDNKVQVNDTGEITTFTNNTAVTATMTDLLLTSNVDLDMTSHTISNVIDPVSDQQVATKKYVDDNAGGGGGSLAYQQFKSITFSSFVPTNFVQTNGAGSNLVWNANRWDIATPGVYMIQISLVESAFVNNFKAYDLQQSMDGISWTCFDVGKSLSIQPGDSPCDINFRSSEGEYSVIANLAQNHIRIASGNNPTSPVSFYATFVKIA